MSISIYRVVKRSGYLSSLNVLFASVLSVIGGGVQLTVITVRLRD